MNPLPKILIIEDDPDIINLVKIHITDLGFELEWASDGHTGLTKAIEKDYALIILDLMLPGLDGLEVCKQLRREDSRTPILMPEPLF
jgi:DNA-binding response OmpR family regulator